MAQVGTGRSRAPLWAVGMVALAGTVRCDSAEPAVGSLVLNEVMSDNDAAWVDDHGEVDDWVEVFNPGEHPLDLSEYRLRDGRGRSYDFPSHRLAGGETLVIAADGQPNQGPLHADFKLSAGGFSLELTARDSERVIDRVDVPALGPNEAFARQPNGGGAFARCRYATPERDNGARCGPPPPLEPPAEPSWPVYQWPERWPASKGPLVLSELALKPARFIEVVNVSDRAIDLGDYQLRVSPTAPGRDWPDANGGVAIDWRTDRLAPDGRLSVPLGDAELAALASDPAFEGVVAIFGPDGAPSDRVDFTHWPEGASLARTDDRAQRLRFCTNPSEGRPNDHCDPLASRDVGDRVRHLYTPGDYDALAVGETNLGSVGVKFIVDLQAGGAIHLLRTRDWALHYTFIRERIDGEPPLDRCDATEAAEFDAGWYAFSEHEYFQAEGRRYLLGTLTTYAGSGLRACEYALGDQIIAPQMRQGFFGVAAHMDALNLGDWAIHPVEPRQTQELTTLSGQLPVVPSNAPYRNLRYQPLTEGVAYGVLRFLRAEELEKADLGPDVVAITDAVPNDIPLVGGLITESFQTPLAHINVLSQSRGTPNMALRDARHAPEVAPFLGTLSRLEVSGTGFAVRSATPEEADTFRRSREPSGPRQVPRLDLSVRGPVDLAGRGLEDLPSLGAKAAQLAELGRIVIGDPNCDGPMPLPQTPFALPMVHSIEHFERSGAKAMLMAAEKDSAFRSDPARRSAALAEIRAAILNTELDPELLEQLNRTIAARFGDTRLRFRSSSNTEDLPGFNGAGLYESWSAALHDPERPIPSALRSVWASLWTPRAYDEREFGHIDQSAVAMGVLIHPAFSSERANVIAITRDVLDPTRSDIYYLNAQAGEASVANPAPGVTTEQLVYHWRYIPGTPELERRSSSSLNHSAPVLSVRDARAIGCHITAIHDHFRNLIDPNREDRWFAMDIEIKLVGHERAVVIKQARPYAFGRAERPIDCREF